jgi:hypothetical protein
VARISTNPLKDAISVRDPGYLMAPPIRTLLSSIATQR